MAAQMYDNTVLKEFKYNNKRLNLWVDSQDVDVVNYTGVSQSNVLDADIKQFTNQLTSNKNNSSVLLNKTQAVALDDPNVTYKFQFAYDNTTGKYGYIDGVGNFRNFKTKNAISNIEYLDTIKYHERVKIYETNVHIDIYNMFHLSDYLIIICQTDIPHYQYSASELQLQLDITNSDGRKRTITKKSHTIKDQGYLLIEPQDFMVDSNTIKVEFYLENIANNHAVSCYRLSLKEGA